MPPIGNLNSKALLFTVFSFSAFTNAVYAQESTADLESNQESESDIEIIEVSVQKRAQALKDVPVSIQVLKGDLIEELALDSGFDLIKYLPGFNIDDSTEIRTTTLKTRGIGTFTNSIGLQSSNLVVIDGEVLPRQNMLNLTVADIDRVEALRGPQGTLFGQNTSTGLIHYVTARPNFDRLGGKVRVRYTEFNGIDLSSHINVPINENWAFRANVQYSDIDGWILNTQPGEEDIGATETKGVRGQLLYDNGQDLDVIFRLEYSERDTNCCSFSRLGDINLNFGPNPTVIGDDGSVAEIPFNVLNRELSFDDIGQPVTARSNEFNFGDTRNTGFSYEANYLLNDDITLSYNGSYRDFELFSASTFFTFNIPIERANFAGNESTEVIQQEFRLSSFNNDRLNWVAGLFYHNTDGQRSEFRDVCAAGARRALIENDELAGCFSLNSSRAFIANFQDTGIADRSILVPDRLLSSGDFTTEFENFAIFGQLEYRITDQLDATFGFRALNEDSSATFSRLDLNTPSEGVGLDTFEDVLARSASDPSLIRRQDTPTEFTNSETAFIYKTVLGYDITDDVRVYANYSTGFKGASYFITTNTDPAQADNFPTDPERSVNRELGLRSGWFNNKFLFNFTLFDLTVEDYQIRATRIIDEETNTLFVGFVNAEEARTTGFETDILWKITNSLTLNASYTEYDARFEDFSNAPVNCPRLGQDRSGGLLSDRCSTIAGAERLDLTGLPFPNNAERQFLGTLTQGFKIGSWQGGVSAVYRYNSEATRSTIELAFDQESNPSNGIWDLRANIGNGKLRFDVFVQNLFDKTYTTRLNRNAEGFGTAFFPRDYTRYIGGSVQYNF
ncbi:TonB-dependent receptor [Alteromonadaceae bacterium M269]|nr:TonB-dependent receptor [Alteromonadaceae bacterium M269]